MASAQPKPRLRSAQMGARVGARPWEETPSMTRNAKLSPRRLQICDACIDYRTPARHSRELACKHVAQILYDQILVARLNGHKPTTPQHRCTTLGTRITQADTRVYYRYRCKAVASDSDSGPVGSWLVARDIWVMICDIRLHESGHRRPYCTLVSSRRNAFVTVYNTRVASTLYFI